jgi:16S rRNA (uracil1498-N3)-methyltransferase
MRIPRFYFPDPLALGARVNLPKDAAHHAARVLRMGEGDVVTLFNGDGHLYRAKILRLDKQEVVVLIEQRAEASRESPLAITLLQGISSGERMDFTLQKSVELGIAAIQPIQAERSVVRLTAERMEKRLRHWQNIVIAACEQCGRNVVPEVRPALGLMEWLGQASGVGGQASGALRIHLSPEAEMGLRDLPKPTGPVVLAVGPEGGFSEQEQMALGQYGFVAVRLGPRVLRTETAALAALAALQSCWGDF